MCISQKYELSTLSLFSMQNAHIALIDALMLAYAREVVTIERVVQAVRHFTSFNASSELPSSTEDAIMFWVNKVCVYVQQTLNNEQKENLLQGQSNQKVGIGHAS